MKARYAIQQQSFFFRQQVDDAAYEQTEFYARLELHVCVDPLSPSDELGTQIRTRIKRLGRRQRAEE